MQQRIILGFICALLFACSGCYKNETHYYDDTVIPGLAIFSNTGNNLMTCQLNGHSWKSRKREYGYGFNRIEMDLRRIKTASATDTLLITWYGDVQNQDQYDISLSLPIAKNFQWKDVHALEGKRIAIDSSNGYFLLSRDRYFTYLGGKGTIYFNSMAIDSLSPSNVNGRMAGLMQANFIGLNPSYQLSNGRFDNNITIDQLRYY